MINEPLERAPCVPPPVRRLQDPQPPRYHQLHPRQRGQGLVEYALIILFVAIALVAILALLGPAIGSIFSQIKPVL
jgi:pilus assembly protein Flp/PilA